MSQNKFLKGAAILGIAGIIVKVMGVFFRIPLTNWVGADGISYYSSVYPIYTFFLILSTAAFRLRSPAWFPNVLRQQLRRRA